MFFLHHAFVDKQWWKWQNLCDEYKNDFEGHMIISPADPSGVASLTETLDVWSSFKVKDMMDTISGSPLCYEYTKSKGDVTTWWAPRCPNSKKRANFNWPFANASGDLKRRSNNSDLVHRRRDEDKAATFENNTASADLYNNLSDGWQGSVSASKDVTTNETVVSFGDLKETVSVRVPVGYHVYVIMRDRVVAFRDGYDPAKPLSETDHLEPPILVLSNRKPLSEEDIYISHGHCIKPAEKCLPQPRVIPRDIIEGQRMMNWDGYQRYISNMRKSVDDCNMDINCHPVSL
jgi:hypothetical protein